MIVPASCEVGAHCLISVRVACPAGARCELDTPGRPGAFELLQVEERPPSAAGDRTHSWQLTLVAFDPGTLDLPAVGVRVISDADGTTRLVRSPASRVDVQLVSAAEDASLRPDAGPLDPGPDWRMVAGWAVGVAFVLAVAALAWRWWRRRPRRAVPAEPAVSAERAIAAIRATAASPARSPEETLERYRTLSDALRGYLGLPLDVPAVALTSTELVRAIDRVRLKARQGVRALPPSRHPSTDRRSVGGAHRAATPSSPGDRGAEFQGRPDATSELPGTRHDRTRALLEHVDDVKFGGERPADTTRADACRRAIALIEELEHGRTGAGETPTDVA